MRRPDRRDYQVLAGVVVAVAFLSGLVGVGRLAFSGTPVASHPIPAGTGPTGSGPAGSESQPPSPGGSGPGSGGPQADPPPPGTGHPAHRRIRVAGVTLSNLFPRESISDLATDNRLGTGPACGFMVNETDTPITVTRTVVTVGAGTVALSQGCDEDAGPGSEGAPGCRGARLRPGQGCLIQIRMTRLPPAPASGRLTLSYRATCTSPVTPSLCTAAAGLHPTVAAPVDLTSDRVFPFTTGSSDPSPTGETSDPPESGPPSEPTTTATATAATPATPTPTATP